MRFSPIFRSLKNGHEIKKIGPKIPKFNIFLPKINQFSIVFKNLSESNKTNKNTYLARISAYLDHFWII